MGCGCKGNNRGTNLEVVEALATKYTKMTTQDSQIYLSMGRYNFEPINPTRRGVVKIIRYHKVI